MGRRGRWILAGLSGALLLVVGFAQAATITSDADANEAIASSAPQQSVVEGQATREAMTAGLQLFGLFGLLTFLNIAAIPGRDNDDRPPRQRPGQEWAKPYDA